MRPLVFGTAIQIAYFIQMKGTEVCRFCFRWLFAFVRCALLLLQRAAKGALFAVFCCYCLRVVVRFRACTLFEAVFVPFARLLLLLQYFVRLARFCAFIWLLLQPSSACNITVFCAPSVRRINARRGKDWRRAASWQATRLRGCVYSIRKPSLSRCSFSAIR